MRGARSEREEAYKISTSTSASEGNEADEPYCEAERRRLAQLVEHHLHTVGVTGSSPVAPTTPTHSNRRLVEETGLKVVSCARGPEVPEHLDRALLISRGER